MEEIINKMLMNLTEKQKRKVLKNAIIRLKNNS